MEKRDIKIVSGKVGFDLLNDEIEKFYDSMLTTNKSITFGANCIERGFITYNSKTKLCDNDNCFVCRKLDINTTTVLDQRKSQYVGKRVKVFKTDSLFNTKTFTGIIKDVGTHFDSFIYLVDNGNCSNWYLETNIKIKDEQEKEK